MIVQDAIKKLVENRLSFKEFDDDTKKSLKVTKSAVRRDWHNIEFVRDEFKDDDSVILIAVIQNAKAILFASDRIKSDINILKNFAKHNRRVLNYLDYSIKEQTVFSMIENGDEITSLSRAVLKDFDLMYKVISKYPYLFEYLSPILKDDVNFALKILESNKAVYSYFTVSLKEKINLNLQVYDESGYNIYSGYGRDGYDRKWLNKSKQLIQIFKRSNLFFESKEQYFKLVHEYINSKKSNKYFCLEKNIYLNDFNYLLERVSREDPILKKKIIEVSSKEVISYAKKVADVLEYLINEDISFRDYASQHFHVRFQDLLEISNEYQRDFLLKSFSDALLKDSISAVNIINILSVETAISRISLVISEYKRIIECIRMELRLGREIPILKSYVKDLEQYRITMDIDEYLKGSPKYGRVINGKEIYINITLEHINAAIEELKMSRIHVCRKTIIEKTKEMLFKSF